MPTKVDEKQVGEMRNELESELSPFWFPPLFSHT
jgi:hypothetical protein